VTRLFPGVVASAITGNLDPGSYFPIATTTLASATASMTFSSIPATYTHLQVRASIATSAGAYIGLTFNGITTAYDAHFLQGDGASATAGAYINRGDIVLQNSNSSSTESIFGGFVIDILDYTNTNKNKTVRTLSGYDVNGAGKIYFESGLWRNTSAITSISLTPGSSHTMTAKSVFTLYGIKG
jgi:hypothetical protein